MKIELVGNIRKRKKHKYKGKVVQKYVRNEG